MKRKLSTRREALLALATAGAAAPYLPKTWTKPIVNAVLTPAHAQTSCSGFTTTAVNEALTLTVTATEVQGPIVVARGSGGAFSGRSDARIDECRDAQDLNVDIQFSGVIDSANNRITGDLIIVQRCGSDLVCEQITTYAVTQDPINSSSDIGDYSGSLTGSLRCCDDFN